MTELNTTLFFVLNNFAGQSSVFDWVTVFFADYLAYIFVAVSIVSLVLWQAARAQKLRALFDAVIAVALSRGVFVESIRWFYPHPRPFASLSGVHQLLTETSSSFPSGHAAFFFALSAVSYHYNRKLGVTFFTLSVIMGLARIIAGVHYPLDILGGALLGVCIGFMSSIIVDKFPFKNVV